ncbi:MAG: acetylxylan esterase [Anaerolineae bacterium]|nr:acetylxylan esterase [Anaerolineae bacterium]
MPLNGYAHMVLDHYVAEVRTLHAARAARLRAVTTLRDAQAYQRRVREAIDRAFAPRPEKTPLNPRVTGVHELPECQIEKVLFESRPGCLVTGNLYLPRVREHPAPCVLGTCGHAEAGKAADLYQEFSRRLARAGFVVLTYDPLSQGERDQYYRSGFREQVGWGTRAHNMMGKQLELLGENFAMWRVWDGVRALDYLLSRPEVDATRVGLTGNSGGGTMTTWLWGVDQRFTMAAPSCFVVTFLRNLENELPADAEQCPPGVLGDGLDMADWIIAGAPKPVLLMGQKYDYFDPRGLREAHGDVLRFYSAMGAPSDRVGLFVGPQGHGYSRHNQEAMVSFFCHHAGLEAPESGNVELLAEADLYAAPNGQVVDAGATPAYTLIAGLAQDAAARRPPLEPDRLRAALSDLLCLPAERCTPPYRVLRPQRREGAVYARFAVETEGSVRAFLWMKPADPEHPFTLEVERRAVLYLPHVSAEMDLAADPLALSLQERGPTFALDVRGLGESLPQEQNAEFFQPYGMDYMFHAYAGMLGQSYVGRRVYDVLRVLDLLVHEGAEEVALYGRGQGAIHAAMAALLYPAVASVTLKNGPRSFHAWTQTPYVTWPAASFCRGILQVCDLPDIVGALGDRVQVLEPWNAEMLPEEA